MSTLINFRINEDLLARIDASAEREGLTRKDYVLSWLPDTYDEPNDSPDRTTPNGSNGHQSNAR